MCVCSSDKSVSKGSLRAIARLRNTPSLYRPCAALATSKTARSVRLSVQFSRSHAERPSSSRTVRSEKRDWIRGAPADTPTCQLSGASRAAAALASAPERMPNNAALLHHCPARRSMHHMLTPTSCVYACADHAVFIGASSLDEAGAWHAARHRGRPAHPSRGSGRSHLRRGGAPLGPHRGAPRCRRWCSSPGWHSSAAAAAANGRAIR